VDHRAKVAYLVTTKPGWLHKAAEDIRRGRRWEPYALFLVGLTIVILGLLDLVTDKVLLSTVLLALSFLVFDTTQEVRGRRPVLDDVLLSRRSFGPLSDLLPGVKDLRIYGPSAVHVLVNSGDIRRFVLSAGGTVRIIVQGDDPASLAHASAQLDAHPLLERHLHSSLAAMDILQGEPGFSYRRLGFNPGFSLLIVNARERAGYVIFESHGFMDDNIADRMHIVISKAESPHWFSYWVDRFEAMWGAAHPPPGLGVPADVTAPQDTQGSGHPQRPDGA
jgi:hypothetical protein